MASVIQDYFGRLSALNRQRGMTGNMQVGKGTIDAALAEGYMDSAYKNQANSRNYEVSKQNADTQKFSAENTAKYQAGILANQSAENLANSQYRMAALQRQSEANNMNALYNMQQLGFQKEKYANDQMLGLGTLGMQALGYGLSALKNRTPAAVQPPTEVGFNYQPEIVTSPTYYEPSYTPAIDYGSYQPVSYEPMEISTDAWGGGGGDSSWNFGSLWNSFLSWWK